MRGAMKKKIFIKKKRFRIPRKGEPGRICERCGRKEGVIRKYGINLCRICFRELAKEIGFKKYS
jgi:small subunit ribosomal protein S14